MANVLLSYRRCGACLKPNSSALHDLSGLGGGLRLRKLGCDAMRQRVGNFILPRSSPYTSALLQNLLTLNHDQAASRLTARQDPVL